MKTKAAFWFIFLLSGSSLLAQSGDKFGSDEQECGKNYTIYFEHYKLKEYDLALPFWKKTVEICPAFSISLWKNGEKMYKDKLDQASTPQESKARLDTLLWIYDQRIQYFGTDLRAGKGYVLGRRGIALLTYNEPAVQEAYDNLLTSVKMEQLNSKPDVLMSLMKAGSMLYENGTIDESGALDCYDRSMSIIDQKLAQEPNDPLFQQAKEITESLFIKSGAADCAALVNLYQNQFIVEQNNLPWIQKVSAQLKRSGCSDDPFFIRILEAKMMLEPNASEAHKLAQLFIKQEDWQKALEFLDMARKLGLDDGEQAETAYELGYVHFVDDKNYQKARDYVREASRLRPDWGEPYLLLGRIYLEARTSAFDSDFDQATVIWAATDQFILAKKADPNLEARANNLIQTWSAYYPTSETAFFHTVKKGDPYRVGSWIDVETTVRTKE